MDFSDKELVHFYMFQYLHKIFQDFIELIEKLAATPVVEHLFKVQVGDAVKLLPEEQAINLPITQLLFINKRARRDTQTPIAFPMSHARQPDMDN